MFGVELGLSGVTLGRQAIQLGLGRDALGFDFCLQARQISGRHLGLGAVVHHAQAQGQTQQQCEGQNGGMQGFQKACHRPLISTARL